MAPLRDIMTSEVFSAGKEVSIANLAEAMVKGRFGSALIVQGDLLLGILTERDVLRAAASGTELTTASASAWMTPDPVTAPPDMDSDEAAELMLSQGFRHLPVLDGASIAGVVSLRDVLSARVRRG
jgi:CBS domain-containing protein